MCDFQRTAWVGLLLFWSILHAVFCNPSSSFRCHLQWEVLHCAIWLTLSISCHSALFFTSMTGGLLWHNLSLAFLLFFLLLSDSSRKCLLNTRILLQHPSALLPCKSALGHARFLMGATGQQLRVRCLAKGHLTHIYHHLLWCRWTFIFTSSDNHWSKWGVRPSGKCEGELKEWLERHSGTTDVEQLYCKHLKQ